MFYIDMFNAEISIVLFVEKASFRDRKIKFRRKIRDTAVLVEEKRKFWKTTEIEVLGISQCSFPQIFLRFENKSLHLSEPMRYQIFYEFF